MSNISSDAATVAPEAVAARVIGVRENIVGIEADQRIDHGHIMKNEVAYIHLGDRRLKSEVLRVRGRTADLQVYEETGGLRVGDPVGLTKEMLSVTLGPGMLGMVYDGLQNPLDDLARDHGFFLPRGIYPPPLDLQKKWAFTPVVATGDTVLPGGILGTVQEGRFTHRIMVPFDERKPVTVTWIQEGGFTVDTPVARIRDPDGREKQVTLHQSWPVRRPIPERLVRDGHAERVFPDEPMTTTIRLIDTFFPIARGGTACIPGPFGAGKTVLQSLISRYSSVDIVIIVACGERAGEVVETITEFPEMIDPKTGGSLMDRTIIICNTSSMPVAARESSIYTGITMGEYYRQMGYDTLVIADSTSRWAQAMRETSGRMEEIPGEEAFPAYLDSAVKAIYERAGIISSPDGRSGSLTMIGTVSPAGGNFEEPVTQATLGTVKTFLGLSADRAYRRFYPAVDPLISWSRYLRQLAPWFEKNLQPGWSRTVEGVVDLLHRGDQIYQMMQVTGEEGVTLDDYVAYQKALLVDMVYLQQDAYDPVDISTPRDRQLRQFSLLNRILDLQMSFADQASARDFFVRLTGTCKNLNYAAEGTPDHERLAKDVETLLMSAAA